MILPLLAAGLPMRLVAMALAPVERPPLMVMLQCLVSTT